MHQIKNILLNTLFFCMLACSPHSKQVTVLEYDGKFPDESARNIEIVMSEEGQITFTLYAPLMNKYFGEKSYTDFPEGILVSSYTNGEKHSTLTAGYAINEEFTQCMEARNNVVIVDLIKQESIITEKIIWDQKKKRVYSDVKITRIKADGTIDMGDGFESDEKFTKYSIRKPRGEFIAEDL